MQWDDSYVISRSLSLQIDSAGRLLARTSQSRPPMELQSEAIPILSAFAVARPARDAFRVVSGDWDVEEDAFASVVDAMLERAVLRPRGAEVSVSLARGGFARLSAHHSMLRDTRRALSYLGAIERHARDRHVLEIGCGTGILSVFAARAGARKVTAIEESEIAAVARKVVQHNGFGDRITILEGNSADIELDEPAEVLIHELIGADPVCENMIETVDDARRRLLVAGARLIPHSIEICCLGLDAGTSGQRMQAEAMAEIAEYGRVYGVRLDAIAEGLSAQGEAYFRKRIPMDPREPLGREILSAECSLFKIDFAADNAGIRDKVFEAELQIEQEGVMSDLLIFFRAQLDEFQELSNPPITQLTHWGRCLRLLSKPRQVRSGDRVGLRVRIDRSMGMDDLKVELVE